MVKEFTTFEEQIDILKNRGLIFLNEEAALVSLRRFGYYNIINGYKDNFIVVKDGEERYKEDVTFEQIYSLFQCDRKIRSYLIEAMLEVEELLRNAVAHTIAEEFGASQDQYLIKSNYRTGTARNGTFKRDEILDKFNKIISDDDYAPINHYKSKYGNVPPWILLKKASFGNLVNFTKVLKGPQKDRVISIMYDLPAPLVSSSDEIKNLFMDTLFLCLDYRNAAAHGRRIYNLNTKSRLRYTSIIHKSLEISQASYQNGNGHTGLKVLKPCLNMLDDKYPYTLMDFAISNFAKNHYSIYPNDKEYLEKYLGKIE